MQSSQLTDIGYIYYREPANQRKITYQVDCPGLHEDREILIDKNQSYKMPAGLGCDPERISEKRQGTRVFERKVVLLG